MSKNLSKMPRPVVTLPTTEAGEVHYLIVHPGGLGSVTVILDTDTGVRNAHRCLNFSAPNHCITIAGEKVDPGQLVNWMVKHGGGREIHVVLHPETPGGSVSRVAEFHSVGKEVPE